MFRGEVEVFGAKDSLKCAVNLNRSRSRVLGCGPEDLLTSVAQDNTIP